MAHASHKLRTSFEGALAGGGDPATSPLYVFGPFLKLIVAAGVARVSFGASVWLVVLTIAVVSAMYRLVMRWVTDGSGGSGLSEEEFGSWAVKIDAAITFIEYTLTFLVSMAAMVTFIADRIPALNDKILWVQYRTLVAVALSLLVGWLVNRGPKMAVRIFGPATAGVLVLLWAMVIATVVRYGVQLPDFNLEAFSPQYLEFTVGGYARILAVMTGIEVFANMVAAYQGKPLERSKKAFQSLLIIMGTTGATMLIVGPAIFKLSDPMNLEVSVFTQTMDALLPAPLPWFGTLVSAAVLMSASAASAQGLQNLSLGLKERQYIPPMLGKQNAFEVADKPVWIEVGIVSVCFLVFGTHEETYLAIYAAGVFILLSLVGWAVTKRLTRRVRRRFTLGRALLIPGTILAALLTSTATVIIFQERFFEGAWVYFVLIPMLYAMFSYCRNRLGEPTEVMDYLGRLDAAQLAGFGFGQAVGAAASNGNGRENGITWQPEPIEKSRWREQRITIREVAVLLDGSSYAATAIPYARMVCQATKARLTLLSSVKDHTDALKTAFEETRKERMTYLKGVYDSLVHEGVDLSYTVRAGFIAEVTRAVVEEKGVDMVITSTRGKSGAHHWMKGGVSNKLMKVVSCPVLLVQNEPGDDILNKIGQILVSLDGSIHSEQALPIARALAAAFGSKMELLAVPQVPEVESYRAPMSAVRVIREQTVANMENFLEAVSRSLRADGLDAGFRVAGSLPVRTIVSAGEEAGVDLITMTSRGRGGLDKLMVGSVAERVVAQSKRAVLMVPIRNGMGE